MKKRTLCALSAALTVSMLTTVPVFAQETADSDHKVQVTASALNVRSSSTVDSKKLGKLYSGEIVEYIDRTDNGWYQISYQDETAYICGDYVTKDIRESAQTSASSGNSSWDGPVLNRRNGTVQGPSGKETYYNLNMSRVVSNMHSMGFEGEYWVRDDGCKMFGNYIMCAANLNVHPRGSLVESSLGTCIVADTGGFASSNPYQLDIAVNW